MRCALPLYTSPLGVWLPHSSSTYLTYTHLTSLIRPHSTLCLINRFDYWLRGPPYEVRPSSTRTSPTHKLASCIHSSNLRFPHVDWERLTREVGTCLILKKPWASPTPFHQSHASKEYANTLLPHPFPHIILKSFPYPSRLDLGSMPFH
jgi:hypothetical protein